MTLIEWAARCIFASFPLGQRLEAAQGAQAYIDFLDTLPVIEG